MQALGENVINDVFEEIFWHPAIEGGAITVSGSRGRVTLRGTVASQRMVDAAQLAAESVPGVRAVNNRLQVEPRPGRSSG